ncbi:MAG: alpha/beta hydrolase [Gemmatimonadota bacterium]|nr:alpha/beta hydrolase [Gemmatimonadota bacterium]MDE2872055.1 alpha/beta hydrolase [Gemmatimonadota bacterium]
MTPLHHDHLTAPGAAPSATMLLLHGIYGAGRNWRTVARRLVSARPGWRVTLVDLRSHGRSPRLAPHTVAACATDVSGVEDHLGRAADAVLGHSFGGKVALLHARRAAPAPRRYWIVDSAPGAGRPAGGAWRMLGVLRRRPGPFGSRAEAVAAVEAEGYSPVVARWMATNVRQDGWDGWVWRIDPDEMEGYLRDYFSVDAWDVVEEPPEGAVIHFVKASASSVLDAEAVARIRGAGRGTGRVFLHEVEGGHWINTENPDALVELLAHGRLTGHVAGRGPRH